MPSYPTINGGVRTQRPWSMSRNYKTSTNDMPSGKRYAYAWRGAGLSGFPVDALPSWEINYPAITASELATLETFFNDVKGRWDTFDFTDPDDSTNITNCRFAMDRLEIGYPGPGQIAVRVLIEEFNP